MNPKQQAPPPGPGMTPGDIAYILFRHKGKIIIVAVLAILAAVGTRLFFPLPYQSSARILIRYVQNSHPPSNGDPTAYASPDRYGENILNSEIEILTSYTVASNVVNQLTARRILAKAGGGTNDAVAARMVMVGMMPDVGRHSDVIDLIYKHPDLDMVQPILNQIIESYVDQHNNIHNPQFNEFLQRQTDEAKRHLQEIETQLQEAKSKANVLDVADSKRSVGEMTLKVQEQIYDAQAQIAADNAGLEQMKAMLPPSAAAAVTNTAVSNAPIVPSDKIAEYNKVCDQLNAAQAKGQTLLSTYTTNNPFVRANGVEIAKYQGQKDQLEKDFPSLPAMKLESKPATVTVGGAPVVDPRLAYNEAVLRANALVAKFKILTNQMAELRGISGTIMSQEVTIMDLDRQKQVLEAQYMFYDRELQKSKANDDLSNNSSINVVQHATPPSRDVNKLMKVCGGILGGGLALAFAIPFLIELYFDRTLKRPLQVQSALGLPYFITMPYLNGKPAKKGAARIKAPKKTALLAEKGAANAPAAPAPATEEAGVPMSVATQTNENGNISVLGRLNNLRPHFETLRDRLMTYFEMINLTHKPKLVAVTSCGAGAGVTTAASGLASSLSETGEGNVLLVNMTGRENDAHHFYKGKLQCALEEVFDKDSREVAQVEGQSRLYVAKEESEDKNLPRVLPKRFSYLLPKMKASDFDYIIFDMPPISQISITPRLARFMDMVLLVVESEKTDRDAAKHAATMLAETKTNVGIILNKTRNYVPAKLRGEF